MPPNVSTVITVYNTPAGWLQECLASVAQQDIDGHQVVIVDDGSTDKETVTALLDFFRSDAPCQIVLHSLRGNQGVGAARQAGIELASAPYVALIGADDVMPPGRLAQQLAAIGDRDVLAGGMVYIAPDGTRLTTWTPRFDPRKPVTLQGWLIADPTVLARRQAVLDAGGYIHARRAVDYELWQRMGARGAGFEITTCVWAHYRVHPDSLSFSRSGWQRTLYDRWRSRKRSTTTR